MKQTTDLVVLIPFLHSSKSVGLTMVAVLSVPYTCYTVDEMPDSLCVCPAHRLVNGQHHEALGLHYTMFLPTLYAQCDAEQRRKWIPLAESFKVLGTYAQTEMGHGQSNCRRLDVFLVVSARIPHAHLTSGVFSR